MCFHFVISYRCFFNNNNICSSFGKFVVVVVILTNFVYIVKTVSTTKESANNVCFVVAINLCKMSNVY